MLHWVGNLFTWVQSGFITWPALNETEDEEKSKYSFKQESNIKETNDKLKKMAIEVTESASKNTNNDNNQPNENQNKMMLKVNKAPKRNTRTPAKSKRKNIRKSAKKSAKKTPRIPQLAKPPTRKRKIVRAKRRKASASAKKPRKTPRKKINKTPRKQLASKQLKVINGSKSQSAKTKIAGKKRKRSAMEIDDVEKPKLSSPKRRKLTSPVKSTRKSVAATPARSTKTTPKRRSTRKSAKKSASRTVRRSVRTSRKSTPAKATRKSPRNIKKVEGKFVEKIYGERIENGKTEYLMKFKGFTIAESEWRRANDSLLCQACIAQYRRDLRNKSRVRYMRRIVRDINKKQQK